MKYLKLIALRIDDFCSSIELEANYGLQDVDELNLKKYELEANGCKCLVFKMASDLYAESN